MLNKLRNMLRRKLCHAHRRTAGRWKIYDCPTFEDACEWIGKLLPGDLCCITDTDGKLYYKLVY